MKLFRKAPLAALICTYIGSAVAGEVSHTYDIPAQPLHSALQKLADQSGIAVFFSENLVTEKSSPALKGQYGTREALQKLLAGTGLTYTFTAEDAVGIKLAPTQINQDDPTRLPAVKVIGEAVYSTDDPNNSDYNRPNAISATKTDTPIMETPFSIQVVPKQVMSDRQVTEMSQALNNVSGVIAANERQGGVPAFWIRGFLSNTYYLNGVRMPSSPTDTNQNMANVERIEVLKGPASILYGRGDPGGLVNLVTKQPLETSYTSIQQQIGSWNDYRTTIDTTGPINKDKSMLYRLNVAYENNDSFINFGHGENIFVAPTLRWNISDSTFINGYMTYQHRNFNDTIASPAFTGPGPSSQDPQYAATYGTHGAPLTFLPRSLNLNQPFSKSQSDETIAGFNWSHDFNQNWNLKQRFQSQLTDFSHLYAGPIGWNTTDSVPFELDNYATLEPNISTQSYYTSLDLTGKFSTFGINHTILLGTDYQHFDLKGHQFYAYPMSSGGIVPPTNPFSPTYYSSSSLVFDPSTRYDFAYNESWTGVYLQDQIKLPYHVFLLAGERFDSVQLYDNVVKNTVTDAKRITPRFGILWQPFTELSLYGNYTTNFGNSPFSSSKPVPPESAQQWEIGIKTELFDKRLTSTLAYYQLTKQNIASADPTDPTGLTLVAIGAARSKGFELDVSGEILPGWKLIGSYSYTDSLIIKDVGNVYDSFSGNLLSTVGNQGKRLGGVPRNAGSIWTTYQLQSGEFRGLKLGGGVTVRDQVPGDNYNDFNIPSYATVGLLTAYETKLMNKKTTFQLNVNNLFDTYYHEISYTSPFAVLTGTPRSFLGSIKVEF